MDFAHLTYNKTNKTYHQSINYLISIKLLKGFITEHSQ